MFVAKCRSTSVAHARLPRFPRTSTECIACLDHVHAEAALTETSCSPCESMSLALLHSQIAFFKESDLASYGLPFSSLLEPRWKKWWSRGNEQQGNSLSPQCDESPVLFTREDQHPSSGASGMVSFGGTLTILCLWLPLKWRTGRTPQMTQTPPPPAKETDAV